MKKIVIYTSGTGFTRQYAEWIAEELACEAVSLKSVKGNFLQPYDCVIYGGWVMAGRVSGLDKIKKMRILQGKKLIFFGVGATGQDQKDVIQWIADENLTAQEQRLVPFFYFEGGFDFDHMGFMNKKMLNMMKSSLEKRQDLSDQDVQMLRRMRGNYDGSDREAIEPLVNQVLRWENRSQK